MYETKEIKLRSGVKDAFNITTNVVAISQKEAESLIKSFNIKFLYKLNISDSNFRWEIKSITTWKCSESIYGAHILLTRRCIYNGH